MTDHRPVLLILNLLLAGAYIVPQPAGAGPPQFGIGDWSVSGTESYENASFLLDGSLGIAKGGFLTLSNCTLIIYCRVAGEHGISVEDGGTLRILNGSDMAAFDPDRTFWFVLEAGARVELSNSTFTACGDRLSGIKSDSTDVTIDNCTITQGFYGCTFNAPATITSTRFIRNYVGIMSRADGTVLRDCYFERNGFGAWPSESAAEFDNCTFIDNSIGLSIYVSECVARACRFIGNIASAVFCWQDPGMDPSNVTLEDCLFEGNGVGVNHLPDVPGNRLWMTNCDFLNNSRYGIEWYSRVPPAEGNLSYWNITRDCRVLNSRMLFAANISVLGGGNLSIAGSNLTLDCISDGENGVSVQPGGRLELGGGTVLRAANGSHPFALRCLAGSSFSMDGALLRDCGWNGSRAESAGPLFETPDILMRLSTVDYCPVAVTLNSSRGAVIESSRIRGLEAGVCMNGSSLGLYNSTLATAGDRAASLDNSSVLECVNSGLARDRLELLDGQSRVNISWYLDVSARWADGSPAGGARVGVRDVFGNEAASEVLGADGLLKGLLLREATLGRLGARNYTPHEVNCSVGTIFNRTLQTMDRSRTLDIVLVDREAPSVEIAYPDPDAYLKSGTVLVSGTASDNLGVEKVELLTDGYRRFSVYLAAQNLSRSVAWNFTLSFFEGPHTVEARVFDPAGNSNSTVVAVTVDFTMPRIRIASPPEGYLTNLSLISVSGYMEPGCRVLLGGSEVKTDRDLFGGTVVLGEGKNTITATATDRAQNSNSSSITVWLDTRPPALDVFWPPEGLRTGIPVVAVNGTMEPGAQVFVNGRSVALTGEPGTFSTAVSLAREKNSIVVDAVDLAGNHNVTARTVVLDTRPPALELTAPPEGYVTNLSSVVLSGFSEGGALLSVDGDTTLVPGEPGVRSGFSIPLSLAEGQNTIFISSADAAGNLNYSVRHVFLDTAAPGLVVNSPASGHRTSDSSVFITGETEPGAVVTINSREVPVGQTGSFSLESRLASGFNRFTVRATDSAGNSNETVVDVQRLAASGEDIFPAIVGPDWPFSGFLLLSALICISEGYLASRYVRKRRGV